MRRPQLALRYVLPGTAFVFALFVTAALVGNVAFTSSIARELSRNADLAAREDHLGDSLVTAADAQRRAALQYLRTPNAELVVEFETRGGEAYDLVRQYLHLPMPLASRMQVEEIKEAHERFEVAARGALGLVTLGDQAAGQARSAEVAARADDLAGVVRDFVAQRLRQHASVRAARSAALATNRRATIGFALLTLAFALLLVPVLRIVVLRPLQDVVAAAARLGAGEPGARVPAKQRYGEFAMVAATFNQMADRVEQSRLLVEQKNHALTDALNDLRHTQAELVEREKLSAMGEMLAGLAHELNNPLAAVMSAAESLQIELAEARDPEARRLGEELARPLVSASIRARDLIRNLLRFSRQSDGGLGAVDLAQALRVATGLRDHAFRQSGKNLKVDVPDGIFVMGDTQKMQHVMLNLTGNALDALNEGGGSGLWVRARFIGEGWVEVVFEDDGPGFKDTSRAFEPFYTTKPVGKGTGLGLAIVHRFIQECGGTSRIENRAEGGARIVLRLRSMTPLPLEPTPAVRPSPATMPAVSGSPTVLIVDDEAALARLQERMLSRIGVQVLLAGSGAAARDILLSRHVDLVISDLRMPGEMDGFALLRWMRTERPELAASALVISGDLDGSSLSEQGIDPARLITKPFERSEYLDRVACALEGMTVAG